MTDSNVEIKVISAVQLSDGDDLPTLNLMLQGEPRPFELHGWYNSWADTLEFGLSGPSGYSFDLTLVSNAEKEDYVFTTGCNGTLTRGKHQSIATAVRSLTVPRKMLLNNLDQRILTAEDLESAWVFGKRQLLLNADQRHIVFLLKIHLDGINGGLKREARKVCPPLALTLASLNQAGEGMDVTVTGDTNITHLGKTIAPGNSVSADHIGVHQVEMEEGSGFVTRMADMARHGVVSSLDRFFSICDTEPTIFAGTHQPILSSLDRTATTTTKKMEVLVGRIHTEDPNERVKTTNFTAGCEFIPNAGDLSHDRSVSDLLRRGSSLDEWATFTVTPKSFSTYREPQGSVVYDRTERSSGMPARKKREEKIKFSSVFSWDSRPRQRTKGMLTYRRRAFF